MVDGAECESAAVTLGKNFRSVGAIMGRVLPTVTYEYDISVEVRRRGFVEHSTPFVVVGIIGGAPGVDCPVFREGRG